MMPRGKGRSRTGGGKTKAVRCRLVKDASGVARVVRVDGRELRLDADGRPVERRPPRGGGPFALA
jgi:hypothetical protein